ncbi:SUMO-specific isopeptidase USPL1 [Acomys russatus]|uniref:SUMO-specific isopeptidase USPL1 n=1 Tax=Acomys russatus TaxID=60746 RepID=UPI0021E30351|nr:SUMO-specific isopeptidase USPL1 [Acomys russatus]
MMDSLKIGNGLPLVGPGTDIGTSSLPVRGCLGKNYDSAKVPTDGLCPACRAKGKLNALKTYRISFQESIFLCEDLQCIYPLGSESLINLISPDLEACHISNKPQKRKRLETSCKNSPVPVQSKRTRSHGVNYNGEVCGGTSSNVPVSPGHQSPGRTAAPVEPRKTVEADDMDSAAAENPAPVSVSAVLPQDERRVLETPSQSRCLPPCQTACVQWRNTQALCWLDCILSVLVHLEVLKNTVVEACSREECVFARLLEAYQHAERLLHTHQRHGLTGEDCKKLTSEIFTEIDTCLSKVRGEIFTKLQPMLRCTLGEMESPVYALPKLLKLQPLVEKLFTYSFSWNFKCSHCGHQYQNRCHKNLVTFTNVVPEWHPLNAAHFGPCNSCNSKSQIRKMVLERASPIFMLHFVEGLPRKDLRHYAFHFEGSLYQVTSVVQYQANDHFITWILDADGSWLECDDLKGPCAKRHMACGVPASEMHIVVWERRSQVPAAEASRLPRTKAAVQPAPAEELLTSPSTSQPTVAQPTHMPVTPQTLPEAQVGAHRQSALSGSKDSVESFLPSALEEPVQEAASVFQIDSTDCLLEDTPVTGSSGLVRAPALPPQASLGTSLLSNSCEGEPVAPGVDSGFTSHTGSADLQGGGAMGPNPGTDAQTPIPTQELKSTAPEKDTQVQLLPWRTETLNPEQPGKSQASHLRKRETTARSAQSQLPKDSQKKAFVGSWVKGLLSRGCNTFMPPCVLAQSRAVTDLQPLVKGANNFDGFKTKSVNRKAKRMSRKAKHVDKPSPSSGSPPPGSTAALPHAGGSTSPALLTGQEGSCAAPPSLSSHSSESAISPASRGDAAADQVHKLRLRLLKKLKAKKKKLAALMSSPHHETPTSDHSEPVSHCGSPNDCESIEDLLNELQHQIDLADGKAGCSSAPGGTSCGSQSHEEILAELLSPTALAEPSGGVESELRYLEMGDSAPSPGFSAAPQSTCLRQDHTYCSPRKGQCAAELCPASNSACIGALNLGSPMKSDLFDDFFPSLPDDTLDIPHFDDSLFESC